jgi:hypothetical protein
LIPANVRGRRTFADQQRQFGAGRRISDNEEQSAANLDGGDAPDRTGDPRRHLFG